MLILVVYYIVNYYYYLAHEAIVEVKKVTVCNFNYTVITNYCTLRLPVIAIVS